MKNLYINKKSIFIISICIIILDQVSKFILNNNIAKYQFKTIIPYVLKINITRNTGAAFSLLSNSSNLLSLISLLVSISLIIYILKNNSNFIFFNLGIAFLLGGTIGNGIDRWRLGHVIDFLCFIPITFPIFNIADVAINLAVIFIFIDTIKKNKSPSKRYE